MLGKKAASEWCMKGGLIGSSYVCPKCGKSMELRERTGAMDEQQKALLEGINTLKNIIENVERRQEELRNTLEKKMEQVEERYEIVAGNFSLISQRVEDFEKKLLACGNATNESKFVPAALVPEPASPVSVKLYTYDGKTNWEVYKIQFGIISEANRWTEEVKPEILQRLCPPADENKTSEPRKSLQEYAFEMQRLTTLAFSDFSANVREMICLEYFVDGCWGCGGAGHLRNNCPRVNQKDPHRANGIESKKVCSHQKGSADGNIEAPSRRPCTENSKYSWRIEKKFGAIDPVVRHVTTPSTSESDPWSDEGNNVRSDVEKCCRTCDPCAARKGSRKRTRGRLQLYNVRAPFERIVFDILGHLPRSSDGNKNILVVMDYFTKWPEAYPIPDQEASTVAEVLVQHWISRFGSLYNCTLIKGETLILLFPRDCAKYSPSTQPGQQLCILSLTAWSAVHETTGYSPSQMLFGRDIRLPADLLFSRPPDAPLAPEEYIEKLSLQVQMEEMHHLARERIGMASEKMKTQYDARATGHDFHEGDKVGLWNPKRRKGLSPKLQMNWEGPYTVLKRLNDVVVRIQKSPHSKPKVIHYNRLALYLGQDE
ncbi:retrovirus-related Pol polyprotein from transposon 412 [Trichonephila clavipes]|nr:retrovirus-related Pol polyprotein from transposon 412 [Trichonephila clavipes]